jgi:hypothetical protein
MCAIDAVGLEADGHGVQHAYDRMKQAFDAGNRPSHRLA